MNAGDLVEFRAVRHTAKKWGNHSDVGLIVELQTRGPVPGAYVLWPSNRITEWVKIENLRKVETDVSR